MTICSPEPIDPARSAAGGAEDPELRDALRAALEELPALAPFLPEADALDDLGLTGVS